MTGARRVLASLALAAALAAPAAALESVPLPADVVAYGDIVADANGVPRHLLWAVCETESGFDPSAGNGTCIGLMGIHRLYAAPYATLAGLDKYSLTDARDNLAIGAAILGGYLDRYGDTYALLCYNNGEGGARKLANEGVTETWYTRTVLDRSTKYLISERALQRPRGTAYLA